MVYQTCGWIYHLLGPLRALQGPSWGPPGPLLEPSWVLLGHSHGPHGFPGRAPRGPFRVSLSSHHGAKLDPSTRAAPNTPPPSRTRPELAKQTGRAVATVPAGMARRQPPTGARAPPHMARREPTGYKRIARRVRRHQKLGNSREERQHPSQNQRQHRTMQKRARRAEAGREAGRAPLHSGIAMHQGRAITGEFP